MANCATGKTVFEIGSQLGCTAIVMAQTAKRVHTLDWHRGSEFTDPSVQALRRDAHFETLAPFVRNIERYGVSDRIVFHVGTAQEILPMVRPQWFDLVFVDGNHTTDGCYHDLFEAQRICRRRGQIVLHDVGYGIGGVDAALDQFLATFPDLHVADKCHSLRVLERTV